MRCGNGNAGASTSIAAWRLAVPRRAERRPIRQPDRPTSRPWIGQAVGVAAERQAVEVDGDAGGSVAARARRFAHGASSGSPSVVPARSAGQTAREGEVLVTAAAQRDAGHPEVGEERRRELAGGERHRRLAPEPDLLHGGRRGGHAAAGLASVAVSGLVIDSRDLPSALIPISHSTIPPMIMIPAPTR